MTWSDAKNYCESLKFGNLYNAHLIEIYNSSQQNFLTEKLLEINRNSNWWLGLTDSETEGIWKWANSGNIASYFYWQYGQPDDYWGGSDFAYFGLWQDIGLFGWDDCTYHDYSYTICQLLF